MFDQLISLDLAIFQWVNSFTGQFQRIDEISVMLVRNQMMKGLVPVLVIWGFWFATRDDRRAIRLTATSIMIASTLSILVGRVLANNLPFRLRPFHDDASGFSPAFTQNTPPYEVWSAFPSDHAVLFFCMAVGVLFISRIAGIFLLLHAAIFVALPRVFLGFHYPGDIVAGAVIGALVAVVTVPVLRRYLDRSGLYDWLEDRPAFSYPFLFFVGFLMANMFGPLRLTLRIIARAVGL